MNANLISCYMILAEVMEVTSGVHLLLKLCSWRYSLERARCWEMLWTGAAWKRIEQNTQKIHRKGKPKESTSISEYCQISLACTFPLHSGMEDLKIVLICQACARCGDFAYYILLCIGKTEMQICVFNLVLVWKTSISERFMVKCFSVSPKWTENSS